MTTMTGDDGARRTDAGDPVVAPAEALQVEDVHAAYERVEVLRGVSLSVPSGSVRALLGPNGAGKSTTLRVISGRMRPTSGHVLVDGEEVVGLSPEKLARRGICSVPEGRGIFPNLTVAENVRMWTYRGGLRRSDVEGIVFDRFPVLAARRRQMAATLSGGEQQMLAMSRALSTNPKLLLLDEISMGLAPRIVQELYEVVAQIAAEGFAILVVEQFAQTALEVADWAYVMTQGRVEMEGAPAEVGEAVADLYLRVAAANPNGRRTDTDTEGP